MSNNSKLTIHSKFKIINCKFLISSFFLLVVFFQIANTALPVLAANTLPFKPQISIGDSQFQQGAPIAVQNNTSLLANYIKAIVKYAVGIVGILATVILMFGGVRWLTAGGSAETVSNAKAWIGASLTGLVLTMCSYLILSTINPNLVNFKITKIETIKQITKETEDGKCTNFSGNAIGLRPPDFGEQQGQKKCANLCIITKYDLTIDTTRSYLYLRGLKYCCVCKKDDNYCKKIGANCMTSDGKHGLCDGSGKCLYEPQPISGLCGVSGKIGQCYKPRDCIQGGAKEVIEESGMVRCVFGLRCCRVRTNNDLKT